MDNATFNAILEERIGKMRAVLARKAGEYASYTDRLHNFKRAAGMLCCTPEEAALGMFSKHMVSVMDMVQTGANLDIDEKLGDAINYLVLIEALLWEQRGVKIETQTKGAKT